MRCLQKSQSSGITLARRRRARQRLTGGKGVIVIMGSGRMPLCGISPLSIGFYAAAARRWSILPPQAVKRICARNLFLRINAKHFFAKQEVSRFDALRIERTPAAGRRGSVKPPRKASAPHEWGASAEIRKGG